MSNHAILTAEAHRDLRIATTASAAFGDDVMCCLTVPVEFRQVQNEYPILFRLNPERTAYSAFALFGFENGENLFLEGDRWAARYRPLAMDIQPFLIGRHADDRGDKQVHIDLGSARVARSEGMRVFDDLGRPTPYLETIAEKLGELDAGYEAAEAFHATLMRFNLLEPLALDITLNTGSTYRFVGFHVINEDRLRALDADRLKELHDKDYLMPIYMALASLSNITKLVDRKNARTPNA
ncbi:MAG: SapC family protein [Asticcacaulis sp.]|uniref:SapC family protein n=1 Tax=Asticcacaulis sp. TaxID=1872648 RepID=UPI0039E34DF8